MYNKKWQATHIAPLQPPTLAAFLPWEGSAGAGRVRPADAKIWFPLSFQNVVSEIIIIERKNGEFAIPHFPKGKTKKPQPILKKFTLRPWQRR